VIRNYNAHAANERTFLAWVRTGLSSVALGTVIKKGSLVAVVVASASSTQVSSSAQSSLSSYGGSVLVGIGIAVVAGAAARFVRTARRIDSRAERAVGIVRFSSAFSRVGLAGFGAIGRLSTKAGAAFICKREERTLRAGRATRPGVRQRRQGFGSSKN
jgi:putative membrane protein